MSSQKFLHLSLTNPQLALVASFREKKLTEFKLALRNGANVNIRDRGSIYSVFELACKASGKKEFIKACVENKALLSENRAKCAPPCQRVFSACDLLLSFIDELLRIHVITVLLFIFQSNPFTKECPLHLAVQSLDSENIAVLLETESTLYVDQKFEDRTALYLLFEQIDSDNWEPTFECIKLLLKYHANINTTDENSTSAIALLVRGTDDWRKTILEYCLGNYKVNVDFRRGQARKAIEKNFPGTHIPSYEMGNVTVEMLRNKLNADTDTGFLEDYNAYCFKNQGAENKGLSENDCKDLLSVTVTSPAKLRAAQRLVDGKFTRSLLSGLLAKCCNRGNVQMLEWLLTIIPDHEVVLVNEDPLLSLLVKQIDVYKDKNKCPFFKIMKILLNDPRTEIDKEDSKHRTALYYAVKYKITHALELLLAKGAYIGGVDLFGDLPISGMDSSLLEKHLDSCVTNNDRKPGDDDYEVKINFSNFIPPVRKFRPGLPYEDEMGPILQMAQSSDKKRLLRHPVISSILLLKWLKLVNFFYINLVICTVFFVSFTIYVVFYYGRDNTPFKLLAYTFSIGGWMYLIIREWIQFLLNMRVYVRSMENGMEVLLIVASGVVLMRDFDDETRRVMSVLVILLSALEFTLLIGNLPVLSISTHMVMLKTVSKNFLKCLVLYSIILLAFAFSFHTLFRTNSSETKTDKVPATTNGNGDDDDQFNQFGEVPLALMKTAVMLTGEFEAANIKFQQSSLSYFVFALFLFFVSIVLFNLMNGLAVSDTTTIKAESEIIGITQRVFVINKYENALKTSKPARCLTKFLPKFLTPKSLQLFPRDAPLKFIAVKPNQSNEIFKSTPVDRYIHDVEKGDVEMDKKLEGDGLLERNKTLGTDCCMMSCLNNMDGKIVKYALEILHSHQENVGSTEYRLSVMEKNVDRIMEEQMELKELIQSLVTTLQSRQ
uniref:Ion transport domain-containing protein n=1 Tax=Anopheles dirus TaxID=7168 RepID=A0A182NMU5_9DIPT